jgi:cyclophilin family peptidyl-prolyl cis-trans isomerase
VLLCCSPPPPLLTALPLQIDLDAALSPPAAENFLHLCRSKAYSNTLFHHLLPGFLVQAGLREPGNAARSATDSRSSWARVEGARGAAVFEPRRSEKPLRRGDVCLACTGPESRRVAGAQWFVVLGAADSLDGKHALIGSVVEGMEEGGTMEKIEKELCDGEGRPLRDIRIRHVEVLGECAARHVCKGAGCLAVR